MGHCEKSVSIVRGECRERLHTNLESSERAQENSVATVTTKPTVVHAWALVPESLLWGQE